MTGARTTFTWKGIAMKGAARVGGVAGVNAATERLRGHSVERAPVDQGDLRGDAHVVPAVTGTGNPSAELVFPQKYAAKQHEDETLNHTEGANGEPAGEARFVSKNIENASRRQEYRDLIGRSIDDALAGA